MRLIRVEVPDSVAMALKVVAAVKQRPQQELIREYIERCVREDAYLVRERVERTIETEHER